MILLDGVCYQAKQDGSIVCSQDSTGVPFAVAGFVNDGKKVKMEDMKDIEAIAISTAIGILILKSLTECILYAQPMIVRMGKNVFAFVADIFMLEFSLPICMSMDKTIRKTLKV